MQLKSRLLFVDTCVYEGKNFQFLTHSLGSLKKLVDAGEVRLLITEVTKNEVLKHIKRRSNEALKSIKAVRKDAMILRNLPDLPCHSIFADVSLEEIERGLIKSFESFLESDSVEVVSIDGVSPGYVFDLYFNVLAPFAIGDKEKEFADAFVLKALSDFSLQRGFPIHVLSKDRDMARYSANHANLICDDSIDAYIDAVNKSVSMEPSVFAAEALASVRGDVMNIAHECIRALDSDFKQGAWGSVLEDVEVYDIKLIKSSLIDVSAEECSYELEFTFKADTVETEKDYDRSPFDHEDDTYPFVLENVYERTFDGEMSFQVRISYQDKLIETVDLYDYDPPSTLHLSPPYNEEVRYLDINGE